MLENNFKNFLLLFFTSESIHIVLSFVGVILIGVISLTILDNKLKLKLFIYFKLALLLVEMDTNSDRQALGCGSGSGKMMPIRADPDAQYCIP